MERSPVSMRPLVPLLPQNKYMKAAPDCKALYQQCARQSAAKDHLITVLQEQLMQLAGERQTLLAIMYSFMATCKLQGIDPAKWLDDVLRRIPTHPQDKLLELLPQFWKPLNTEKAKSA